jgi:hypothetical protein
MMKHINLDGLVILMFAIILMTSCTPDKVKPTHLQLSQSQYRNVDFGKIARSEICGATLYRALDTNHVIVAGTYRIDTTFNYIPYQNTDSLHSLFLLRFDNDSIRHYAFCLDVSFSHWESGDLYRFSSGQVHRTICESDTAHLRIIFDIKDAWFKRGADSVVVDHLILWNELPIKEAMHQSFILGLIL